MSAPQRLHLALLPLVPAALALLVWLGLAAFREALAQGGGAAWLMAWALAFLVGMPVLVPVLALAGAAQRRAHRHAFVPNTGEKIPGAGQ